MTKIADRYAEIKMNIEKLEAELNVLKAEIKATGQDAIEGDYFTILGLPLLPLLDFLRRERCLVD